MSISQFVISYNLYKIMRLKELRQEHNKTQKEVADFLNVKQNTYSQYENEKRQVPVDILMRLADYYDVSVDYLLGRADI